jgi:hypothetical protein
MSCYPQYNPYGPPPMPGPPMPPCPPPPVLPQYPLICVGTGPTGNTGPTGPAGPKTFVIDHPIKPNNYLIHACLEGPEAGIYYRGRAEISLNNRSISVELPNYVDSLAKNFTINVSHIFDEEIDTEPKIYAATNVKDGKFKIYGPPGKIAWVVFASRGEFDVEPLKSSVGVKGDGPYKYI